MMQGAALIFIWGVLIVSITVMLTVSESVREVEIDRYSNCQQLRAQNLYDDIHQNLDRIERGINDEK